MANAALISLKEICVRYLVNSQKTTHSMWKVVPAACKGVQELSMLSLPIVHHVKLYKEPNAPYFKIPEGFVDWVTVGMFEGSRYVPLPVSNNLLPFLPQNCKPNPFSSAFGSSFKHGGEWKSWLNRECSYNGDDFFKDDFFDDDYSEGEVKIKDELCCTSPNFAYGGLFPYGWGSYTMYGLNTTGEFTKGTFTYLGRPDEVTFNIPKKMIIVPDNFPSNCLYLSFIGDVQADTMTQIPLIAEAAIHAYIDWYIESRKRNNVLNTNNARKDFDREHRYLRARLNELTTTAIYRVINKGYRTYGIGTGSYTGNAQPSPTTVIYQKKQGIIVYGTPNTDYAQSFSLVGTTTSEIAFVILDGVSKNTGFYVEGDKLIFTDGTSFGSAPPYTAITVYYL